MSFIAVAGLAITAGAAAYSGYNASQGPDDPSAVFGKKPKVAPYVPIDLSVEQGKATASNLANVDNITQLLDRLQPGFTESKTQAFSFIDKLTRGEIPQDLQDQILRNDAYQSMIGGYGGTGMAHNLTARDLGRTSLDLFNQGTNAAQTWTKIASDAYQPYLITTKDETSAAAANNAGQQATLQNLYNVQAAPDPAAAGAFNYQQAQNAALQQSIGQFGNILSTLGRQYNQPQIGAQSSGSFGSNVGGTYVYDPTTGTYVRGG